MESKADADGVGVRLNSLDLDLETKLRPCLEVTAGRPGLALQEDAPHADRACSPAPFWRVVAALQLDIGEDAGPPPVGGGHVDRIAFGHDLAPFEEQSAVAVLLDADQIVRHEDHRPALALVAGKDLEAFGLEARVADGKHLVHEQDRRLGLDGDREAEAHLHARGVVLELLVGKAFQVREMHDRVHPAAQLRPAEAEDGAVQVDVLASGELRVEAHAELQEGRHLAADPDAAGRLSVDAGEDLEQRALARAVGADDAQELTLGNVEADILERQQLAVAAGRDGVREAVLQMRGAVQRHTKALGQIPDLDDRAHSDSAK